MSITSIHEKMRRCLLQADGTVTAYLDATDSHNLDGVAPLITGGAVTGTTGLTLKDTGAFASGLTVGQYVKNTVTGFYHQIASIVDGDTLTLKHQLGSVGTNWGRTTSTVATKLVNSGADFVTAGVLVGDLAVLRDLSAFGVITNVTATELTVDNDIFPTGTNYSILKGFKEADTYEVCTARLDGAVGQVMVEIPKFHFKYSYEGNNHNWLISEGSKVGFRLHPAFVRANGSHRPFIYYSAFEGVVDDDGFADGTILTGYNLSTATLKSLPGLRPVVNGQRSEFRQVSGNNGSGWHQVDWYSHWAVQLLYMVEYEDLNSQSALGDGLTTWDSTQRDNWVVNTSNRAVIHTGYSMKAGNGSVNENTGAANGSGYMSYRGIENFYGQIWKWLDGVNVSERRVYLKKNTPFSDDTTTGYEDTGLVMPASSGSYIRDIHPDGRGLIPNNVSGGSASTYMADTLWTNTGWRVVFAGGGVYNGAPAGFASLLASFDSSTRVPTVGGRVCFKN